MTFKTIALSLFPVRAAKKVPIAPHHALPRRKGYQNVLRKTPLGERELARSDKALSRESLHPKHLVSQSPVSCKGATVDAALGSALVALQRVDFSSQGAMLAYAAAFGSISLVGCTLREIKNQFLIKQIVMYLHRHRGS
jgi:hypothetical protein